MAIVADESVETTNSVEPEAPLSHALNEQAITQMPIVESVLAAPIVATNSVTDLNLDDEEVMLNVLRAQLEQMRVQMEQMKMASEESAMQVTQATTRATRYEEENEQIRIKLGQKSQEIELITVERDVAVEQSNAKDGIIKEKDGIIKEQCQEIDQKDIVIGELTTTNHELTSRIMVKDERISSLTERVENFREQKEELRQDKVMLTADKAMLIDDKKILQQEKNTLVEEKKLLAEEKAYYYELTVEQADKILVLEQIHCNDPGHVGILGGSNSPDFVVMSGNSSPDFS
jgi:chromosome segregation ATPase